MGSVRALGTASLRVNNPNPHRRTPQLLLETDEGIAWRLLADLHPLEAGPGANLHSLILSTSGQTLLGLIPADGENTADGRRYTPNEEEQLALIDVATGRQRMTPCIRRGRSQTLHYSLAPNEQDLAVVIDESAVENRSITLSILRGPDLTVSVQRVFDNTYMGYFRQRDTQPQWSPDGRFLALSVCPVGASVEALLVVDGCVHQSGVRPGR
ncbi:hypothetical protein CLV37_1211 [Kineococcus rhizosphaerae]|uniref:WD40 repeat protein n=1 Tax=Kineococcus rhizosphaerae TaxID=559628 RepID=A0A2T0QUV7_9ACTN|nr:hypothetical protein CLV37_1211 [Kineococcus rhizosphaerae]